MENPSFQPPVDVNSFHACSAEKAGELAAHHPSLPTVVDSFLCLNLLFFPPSQKEPIKYII